MASSYQKFADKHSLFYDAHPHINRTPLINDVFKTHKSHDQHLVVGHDKGHDVAILERYLLIPHDGYSKKLKLAVMAVAQAHQYHFLLLGREPGSSLKSFLGDSLLNYRVRKLADSLFLMAKLAQQEILINLISSSGLLPQDTDGYYFEFLRAQTVCAAEIEHKITAEGLQRQYQALINVNKKLTARTLLVAP